jgi:hypothetical protein
MLGARIAAALARRDDATTGPFANLLAQLCKPADAECICMALVTAACAIGSCGCLWSGADSESSATVAAEAP